MTTNNSINPGPKCICDVVPGVTALIVWLISHFIFLVAAIAAYAFLLALGRFKKCEDSVETEVQKIRERSYRQWDACFMMTFPVLYLVFNVIYWTYYS